MRRGRVRDAVQPQAADLAQPLERVSCQRALVSLDAGVGQVEAAATVLALGAQRLEVFDRCHEAGDRLVAEGAGLEAMTRGDLLCGSHSVGRECAREVASDCGDA